MEGIDNSVLLKSEKIPQKKKIIFLWIIVGLLFAAFLIYFIVDYCSYKKGQKFGLECAITYSTANGSKLVDKSDSYADQCKSVYYKLDFYPNDYWIFDLSEARKEADTRREVFAVLMEKAGYDRYKSESSVKYWFAYTNPFEFFKGCYGNLRNLWDDYHYRIISNWHRYSPLCLYAIILFSLIFTISVNHESKKEIVVYDDSVVCKTNRKKSKQLIFDDVSNVDFSKNALTLTGTGVKFKISNITNAEEIKTFIIGKKKESQNARDISQSPAASSADELKKYKELFDSGVISQEEFDAKKKQLLGL